MKFALLKWTSGEEFGMLSVLDITSVRGYDKLSYVGDGVPETTDGSVAVDVVVEWRAGKKPRNGWPIYQAQLLRVAETEAELDAELEKKQREALLTTVSPDVQKRASKRTAEEIEKISKVKKLRKVDQEKGVAATLIAQIREEAGTSNGESDAMKALEEKCRCLEAENKRLKNLLFKEAPKLMQQMQIVLNLSAVATPTVAASSATVDVRMEPLVPTVPIKLPNPQLLPMMSAQVPPPIMCVTSPANMTSPQTVVAIINSTPSEIGDMVEIFPGSGVMSDRLNWAKAKHTTKASQYARSLLVGVFDTQTLMTSNLKGGANKRDLNAESKKALDPQKLMAIYNATNARFPAVPNPQVGVAMSQKLTEMRLAAKEKI